MQRTIKFRGKRSTGDGAGQWVYGSLIQWNDGSCSIQELDTDQVYPVDDATVGQYTGLKDQAGTEIYEGDVVKSHHLKIPVKGEVVFSEFTAGFTVRWEKYISGYVLTDEKLLAEMRSLYDGKLNRHAQDQDLRTGQTVAWEIIGNIHDTPNPLETSNE